MSNFDDGGPAFPVQDAASWQGHGMSLRQYAAIKLRVPNSGTDWLDEMILTSLRDDLAAKAMQGLLACKLPRHIEKDEENLTVRQLLSKRAYSVADAMLAARGEEK